MSRVYLSRRLPARALEQLRAAGHEVTVNPSDRPLTPEELRAALAAAPYEGLITLLTDRIDAETLAAAPALRVVANYAVGYDNIDVAATTARNIVVTHTPGVLDDAVAEHTLALLLAAAKRVPEGDRLVRAGHYQGWAPELLLGVELRGKTLGIVGAGRIGTKVAHAARSFGLHLRYTDIQPNPELERETGAVFVATLDELLPTVDIVTLHVPLLPATHHLFDARRLGLMKPTAILINTSRGPVIDETALVAALRAGTIRAAALDVYEHEPALTSGLIDLPNVVLTPHTASATEEARTAMAELAAESVIAVLAGREPKFTVPSPAVAK